MKFRHSLTILASAQLALSGAASAHIESAAPTDADAFDESFSGTEKSFLDRFTFGSYGELHGRIGDGADNIDAHRLVAMVNFQFNDKLRFVSELEFEHAISGDENGTADPMKIELEQAYFEYALRDDLLLNVGVQIIPVGIINQVHEPTTFYGVERPNVEKYLIPTTWWEGAVGVTKTYDTGLQLDVMAHTGLDMTSDGYIRSGRPKLHFNQYTEDTSLAVTGRAKYTGISGVELASSLQYQNDVSSTVANEQEAYLAEAHAIYRKGGFELRALGTYWKVQGFADSETEDQWGYYIEPSYKFDIPWGKFGYFARFSQYEYYNGGMKDRIETTVGVNYWPIEEVVFKADFSNVEENDVNGETINLGVGYFF